MIGVGPPIVGWSNCGTWLIRTGIEYGGLSYLIWANGRWALMVGDIVSDNEDLRDRFLSFESRIDSNVLYQCFFHSLSHLQKV